MTRFTSSQVTSTWLGGNGNDDLSGNFGQRILFGNSGTDVLRGKFPAMTMSGVLVMNTLEAIQGNDVF